MLHRDRTQSTERLDSRLRWVSVISNLVGKRRLAVGVFLVFVAICRGQTAKYIVVHTCICISFYGHVLHICGYTTNANQVQRTLGAAKESEVSTPARVPPVPALITCGSTEKVLCRRPFCIPPRKEESPVWLKQPHRIGIVACNDGLDWVTASAPLSPELTSARRYISS